MISLHHSKAERAAEIVKRLKIIQAQLTWTLQDGRNQTLVLQRGANGGQEGVYIPTQAAQAAFRVWQDGLRATAAKLRREAAQINLNVEGL